MKVKDVQLEFDNLLDISKWKLTPYQILVLGFAGLILCGAFLLMLPGASAKGVGLSFVDALFTATSAVCVTGLIVVDTGTYFSYFGQMVVIGLIQAGGFGIMTMATLMALIMRRKIQLKERLIMQEALNQLTLSGIVRLTEYVVKVTLLIEFIGGTILALRWYPEFGLKGIYFG
jgi:trk system potassium uptake protein TrkH